MDGARGRGSGGAGGGGGGKFSEAKAFHAEFLDKIRYLNVLNNVHVLQVSCTHVISLPLSICLSLSPSPLSDTLT